MKGEQPEMKLHWPSFEEHLACYIKNISKKFSASYGNNCALTEFHMGPVWDWDDPAHRLSHPQDEIDYSQSPFERGVWLLHWKEIHKLDK